MKRDDLPPMMLRQLVWQRRTLARDVGKTFDQLIEARVDPTPFLEAVQRAIDEATATEYRDAA